EEIKNSDEGTNIRNFSHYSAEFWNHLYSVQKYINKLCTDDEHTDFMEDMLKRFKDYIPFEKVLIVGCGNGWVERRLADMNIAKHFDAFDISDEYLEEARSKKNNRNINYFVDDINELNNLPDVKYDAIFNIAILHHAEKIENAVKKLSNMLKPDGLIFNYEYVGPAQNQYSNEHLKIMEEINNLLPERLQSKSPLRPPIQNFRVEPTEAIHSDLVRPIIRKYFYIIFEREFNGGIAYQILWNNISAFKDELDMKAEKELEKLLKMDLDYTKAKKVPTLFWYSVGMSKFNS
ncbi:MAG: class I SAM-dependent methyltransferase, partial [Nitrosopumilus sp.]|nr:class I SAM-dependent methyltransferase [Nitrosopumilus sp.]